MVCGSGQKGCYWQQMLFVIILVHGTCRSCLLPAECAHWTNSDKTSKNMVSKSFSASFSSSTLVSIQYQSSVMSVSGLLRTWGKQGKNIARKVFRILNLTVLHLWTTLNTYVRTSIEFYILKKWLKLFAPAFSKPHPRFWPAVSITIFFVVVV